LTEDAPFAAAEVDRWLQSSNRRFTPLESDMRQKLEAYVSNLQVTAPSPRWDELKRILAHS